MHLTTELAQSIIDRTQQILDFPTNVMDTDGMILASSNPARTYQKHTGAIIALTELKKVEITEQMALEMRGTKPGVNLPIMFQGKAIGVVGVSGPPDKLRYVGELIKMAAEMTVEHAHMLNKTHWSERRKEELILQWIESDNDFESIISQAQMLNININKPYTIGLIEFNNSLSLQKFKNWISTNKNHILKAEVSNKRLVLLVEDVPTISSAHPFLEYITEQLTLIFNDNFKLALGRNYQSPKKLNFSYESAIAVLNCGKRLTPNKSIYLYNELELPILFDHQHPGWSNEIIQLPNQLLEKEEPHIKTILRNTLLCWFDNNLDSKKTSELLYIHRNTLRYRLNKISKICNIDLNNHKQIIYLYLSIIMSN